MPTANITKVWQDDERYYVAAQVAEGGKDGNVEYTVNITKTGDDSPFKDIPSPTPAQIKTALTAALKSKRDTLRGKATVDIGSITGAVTI